MVMMTLGPARSRLLERVSAPVSEPLSLEETKLYLRVDGSLEDALIGDLIASARIMAEQWLRKSLLSQVWRLGYDYGICDHVWLPMGPVMSVESVVLFDRSGGQTVFAPELYGLNAARDALVLDGSAMAHRVEITYHTGYGVAGDVPAPIRQGMLAHVALLYDNRGDGMDAGMPMQAAGLYMPFREVRL
jgi:uncharacterized phiE125 gp8 family phage protein